MKNVLKDSKLKTAYTFERNGRTKLFDTKIKNVHLSNSPILCVLFKVIILAGYPACKYYLITTVDKVVTMIIMIIINFRHCLHPSTDVNLHYTFICLFIRFAIGFTVLESFKPKSNLIAFSCPVAFIKLFP